MRTFNGAPFSRAPPRPHRPPPLNAAALRSERPCPKPFGAFFVGGTRGAESRPPSGQSGEAPTEPAAPIVSARFMEVSRLHSVPLDTTRGRAGEAHPCESTSSRLRSIGPVAGGVGTPLQSTSSRPETRPRRGGVERPPRRRHPRSYPAGSWRCLDCAVLRSTRPVGRRGRQSRSYPAGSWRCLDFAPLCSTRPEGGRGRQSRSCPAGS